MVVGKFINEFLSQCDDTIICLHSPNDDFSTTFSIHEWNNGDSGYLSESDVKVSQIVSKVENYHYNLAIVIHIYTDNIYEEAK